MSVRASRRYARRGLWWLAFTMLLASCGGPSPEEATTDDATATDAGPRVAVAIEPYAWLVRQIEPDAEIAVLVAPGETPETFQPTDAETARLVRSRVYFRAGVPFERGGWLSSLESTGLRLVDLRDGVDLRAIDAESHDHGHDHGSSGVRSASDPHLWLSPRILARQARLVADVLSEITPDRADRYRLNRDATIERLEALDRRLTARLAPYRGRSFVVFHPSWGYFADAYELRQLAVEIAGQAPSDAEIAALDRAMRETGTTTIFVPPQLAGPTARTVADALGAEIVRLDPLAADVEASLHGAAEALVDSFKQDA